jgi:arsenate reductase/ArsR family transcriptional regulator
LLFRHFDGERNDDPSSSSTRSRQDDKPERKVKMSDLARSVGVHKALAHPVRQRLVAMLRDGELCVCQMTAVLGLAASTVSAHLTDLRRAGLLVESKSGRFVSYGWSADPAAHAPLAGVVARIGKDPQVAADAKLVRSLRRVDVEKLCRVELDLSRLGIRRPVAAAPGARRQEGAS